MLFVAALTPIGTGLYKLSKYVEKRTGSSTAAYVWVPMTFLALVYAGYGAWLVTWLRK